MRKFYEIMNECNIDSIRHYIKKVFNLNKKELKDYMVWYKDISKIKPSDCNNTIIIDEKKISKDLFYIESINPCDVGNLNHYSLINILSFSSVYDAYEYPLLHTKVTVYFPFSDGVGTV